MKDPTHVFVSLPDAIKLLSRISPELADANTDYANDGGGAKGPAAAARVRMQAFRVAPGPGGTATSALGACHRAAGLFMHSHAHTHAHTHTRTHTHTHPNAVYTAHPMFLQERFNGNFHLLTDFLINLRQVLLDELATPLRVVLFKCLSHIRHPWE